MSKPISLGELGEKVGIPAGSPVSMEQIAEKIGVTKRPIQLSELAKAVDELVKHQGKKDKQQVEIEPIDSQASEGEKHKPR